MTFSLRHPLAPIILAAVAAPTFIVVGALALQIIYERWQRQGWGQAEGIVTVSEVEVFERENGTFAYRAELRYAYSRRGREREGTLAYLGGHEYSDSPAEAEVIAARYRPGDAVLVYYSLYDPDISVLEPGLPFAAALVLGASLLFPFVCIVLAIAGAMAALRVAT